MLRYIKNAESDHFQVSGHYGASRTVRTRKGEAWIDAGMSDHVEAYEDTQTGWLFVTSENYSLGYWGMEVFDGTSKIGELFCDTEEKLIDCLYGNPAEDFNGRVVQDTRERIRRLRDYATGYEIRELEDRTVTREEENE